jgi:hypothetical protein
MNLICEDDYKTFWVSNLSECVEKLITEKFKGGLIPFTEDYFDIYKNRESAFGIKLIPVSSEILAVDTLDWREKTDFLLSQLGSATYDAFAVHLHQHFIKSLVDYVFGFKQIHEKYLYFDSRALYDTVHNMYNVDGIDSRLVSYLKKGYNLSQKRFLKTKKSKYSTGCDSIRIVLDHYNYPEPYFKKILIYCIKNKVWPTFDMFVKNVVYPLSKVRIIRKETHDSLGKSTDSNRGMMYENAGINICEVISPHKEISNLNIWTFSEDIEKDCKLSDGTLKFV